MKFKYNSVKLAKASLATQNYSLVNELVNIRQPNNQFTLCAGSQCSSRIL